MNAWIEMKCYPFILVVLFGVAMSSLQLHSSSDILDASESLSDNQTIVSASGRFEFGFFAPTNSTCNLYAGIWYAKFSVRRVVWVANRENPVRNHPGVVKISDDGNLSVLDSAGVLIWSSRITSNYSINSTYALLLDSGNLELIHRDENSSSDSRILWQSFDFPTDTVLPNMEMWSNIKTKTAKNIISWKNEQDPSPGNFTFSIDPVVNYQYLTTRGSKPYWRSQVWTGISFDAVYPPYTGTNTFFITFKTDEHWINFTLQAKDVASILMLNYKGVFESFQWSPSSNQWTIMTYTPAYTCDTYGFCGPFGICDYAASPSSQCRCFRGFEPKVPEDWNRNLFQGGCVRKKSLSCNSRDGFFLSNSMKLPDHAVVDRNVVNISNCRTICLKNCSCTAYLFSNTTVDNLQFIGCFLWFDELMDLGIIPSSGLDLYIRLAASELGGMRRIMLIIISSLVVTVVCIALVYMFMKRKRRIENERFQRLNVPSSSEDVQMEVPDLPVFNYNVVLAATNSFSDSNKIGQGGFGKVYRGKLPDGTVLAMKRLSWNSGQGMEEFINEVTVIAKLQHRNLVGLLGFCVDGDERILIYEYMPNNSLCSFVFDDQKRVLLDWTIRFNIIKGIARGLIYLHQDSRLKVIHRDLKASNILLDKDWNPRISDFGMARIFAGDQKHANTNRVVGTYGYMSPEYAMKGLFSVKSDVYSYGVLVLEIVTGIRNTSAANLPEGFPSLISYAWELWNVEKMAEMIDSSIRDSCLMNQVTKCIHVGLLCVQDHASDRPTMSSVGLMLENQSLLDVVPEKPTFTVVIDKDNTEVKNPSTISFNDITISELHGR